MKALIFVPLFLVAFLAGPLTLTAQSNKEKKINRELRKIEKASQKLQKLQGMDFEVTEAQAAAEVNAEEIAGIHDEALAHAEQAREEAQAVMEEQKEAMEQQKEAMEEQQEAAQDQKREIEERMIELKELDSEKMEQLREMQVEIQKNFNGKKFHPFIMDVPDVRIDMPELKRKVYAIYRDQQDNLSINKTLTDESGTGDFNYEVKEGASGVTLIVNGAIDSGKVKVIIKRPDGEVYNEYTFSSLASVNYRQTVKFEGMEETQYIGKWTVNVTAEKAKGTYSVQMNGR